MPNPYRLVVDGGDQVLLVLTVASAVLVGLAVALGAVALGSHAVFRFRERRRRARRRRWRTHLLAVLAGERTPRSLVDTIRRRHVHAFLNFLAEYATTLRGREMDRVRALARPFMPRVRRHLVARSTLVRARAVQRIGLLGGPEHTAALRDRLDDPADRVAEMAFRRLAKLGGADEAESLLRRLDQLDHVDHRQLSSALVDLGEEAAPAFRAALADGRHSSFVRMCCAEALRWLSDPGAAAVAGRLLEDTDDQRQERSPELTASLLRLLRRVGQSAHAPVVRPYCRSPVSFVRIHAARALGQLGGPEDESLLTTLLETDASRWVALSAAQSLSELNLSSSLRQLTETPHPRAALAANVLSPSSP